MKMIDRRGQILHVACLQCLVMAMLARMATTDLEGLREILNDPVIKSPDTAPELAHYSPHDRKRLRRMMNEITGVLQAGVLPPASRA